ncbi:hypothetical protein Q765_19815 [Flavobacterium rivuli WB 3.3-2 = DSM 21788]|uniref:Carbohydrate-binding protein SusD n=1 Tax=Flavobacterium rivuli WB 3.3-2 = DSM 21788 TaxID=1121895 RepID=A0A0A2LZY0_9FLAO|nr:RagB/SusD family nutrient uptake outer membrane protein [Flavobacterium rivuli]KGO84758.1 hypothetical protein Q765_19815 [Flavobacterium rivuli WB 3.3-2 = DSM 21788]
MKNIRILLFVVAASLFSACNDAIDIIQPSELTPEVAFETVEDLRLGLNGVYSGAGGENIILFTSLFTDEVKLGRANGGQGTNGELAFQLNAASGDPGSIWLSNYTLINYANRLIAGAANVTPTEAEQDEYNDIIAQCRVLRAWAHFQLLTFFSEDMTNDNALGVIAVDFVPTTDQQLARNTNAEVYALINSDFAFADENLIRFTNRSTNRTAVSIDFVNALRSRMALYRGRYEEANTNLDALITAYPLTQRGAVTAADGTYRGDYFGMFKNTNLPAQETIFKLERTIGGLGNFYQYWASVNSTTTGSPFYEVSTALFNTVNTATDGRRSVIVDVSAAPSYTIRPVGKYTDGNEQLNLLGDVQIFRGSELRFIKAEILANAGDLQGAMDYVNLVRRARNNSTRTGTVGVLPLPSNGAVGVWKAILDERRAELAFEGFRYTDLRRLGAKANATVDRAPADCAFNDACTLPIDDHRWIMPIPLEELQANRNIQQNPGY